MTREITQFKGIDRSKATLSSLSKRESKVDENSFAGILKPNASFQEFLQSLPAIFKGKEFPELVNLCAAASLKKRKILLGMGAHVIKTGLNPLLIDMMERGLINGISVHGASAIHDTEIAINGQTSEDVAKGLQDGTFGMVRETGQFIFSALGDFKVPENHQDGNIYGFGYRLGKKLTEENPPYVSKSLFAAAYRLSVPITVHVGIGTDIIHQHPDADGELIGKTSYYDFQILAENLSSITDGGGFINFGSAVIIPEVFLKALTLSRNIYKEPYHFFTANFDQILHYRPHQNILFRPTQESRYKGYHFTGHHEIMIPLFLQAWKEELVLKAEAFYE